MSETVEAGTAIALLGERALVATEVFKPGGVRVILDQIKAEVAKVKIDGSTPEGREECRSLAFKIARSKTALDAMGKKLTEDWRKSTTAVNAERNLIEKELDALRDQVRKPLTDWEARDVKRVEAHRDALAELVDLVHVPDPQTIEQIDDALAAASKLVTTRTWEEFQMRASDAFAQVNDALNDFRVKAIQRDKERAEAAEREEQARLQAVREQEAREARLAAEAAGQARQVAEARAAREATEAAQKAAEEIDRRERASHAREDAAKRQAEADRLATERRYEAELEAQRQRSQAAYQGALARLQAEERAKAQAAAERAREEERERVRVQQEADRVAAELREKNVAHQRKINREARDAIEKIVRHGMDAAMSKSEKPIETAQAIVVALAKGEVPHVRISY